MAVVKNKTGDTLSLFSPDAPPIDPGGEVTVRDEVFVDRAWPMDTWDLITPPELEGYEDATTEDAWLWAKPPTWLDQWLAGHRGQPMSHPEAFRVEEVVEYLANVDDAERARVIALESAGKARKTITEWSGN